VSAIGPGPPAADVPLDDPDLRALIRALHSWARAHPEPDRPLFGYAGTGLVSPRQLALEVERGTVLGRQYLADIRAFTERVPFARYIELIDQSRAPRWRVILARVRRRR
jgi:hypothetical protein